MTRARAGARAMSRAMLRARAMHRAMLKAEAGARAMRAMPRAGARAMPKGRARTIGLHDSNARRSRLPIRIRVKIRGRGGSFSGAWPLPRWAAVALPLRGGFGTTGGLWGGLLFAHAHMESDGPSLWGFAARCRGLCAVGSTGI